MGGMHGEQGMGMGGMATLTNSGKRSREIVRHQQMLDQLLELMR